MVWAGITDKIRGQDGNIAPVSGNSRIFALQEGRIFNGKHRYSP